MTATALGGLLLLALGTVLDVPVAVVLAIVILLLEVVRSIWARYGLRHVAYARRLSPDRIGWGEEASLEVEVWNRKPLPLAWLRADDEVTSRVAVRERGLADTDHGGPVLRNVWTLAPFERVVRRFHVRGDRRGLHELGPVTLSVGDLFAREAAVDVTGGVDRFLVRPRVVPTPPIQRRDTVGGIERARFGLSEDPARFAGIREYAPGDPLRRVHSRASARLGRPVVKVFEPSREREVLIALDVEQPDQPGWEAGIGGDEVEELFVVAASIARSLAAEQAAFGILAAGYHGAARRLASIPVAAAPGQLERVLDLLAQLSAHPSAPFEVVLARILQTTRAGTTVLVVSTRSPGRYVAALRRLERAGCPVLVVACGPAAGQAAQVARRAGIAARVASLDDAWRTARRLELTR